MSKLGVFRCIYDKNRDRNRDRFSKAYKMRYKIRLDNRTTQKRKNGFPVVVFLSQNSERKKVNLKLFSESEDWDFEKQLPKNDRNKVLAIQKKKLLLDHMLLDIDAGELYSLERVKNTLLGIAAPISADPASFLEFAAIFIQEKKDANSISTALGYENAVNRMRTFRSKLLFSDIDYNLLNKFKAWRLADGNSKSTVHTYLRKYRTIWNEAFRRGHVSGASPFEGVFQGITVKANRTKKRNISKASIQKLEAVQGLTMYHQRAVDLFLLLFYCGGQDLKDVYYLENSQINKGRIYFVRGKLSGNGYEFDLKIVPKAQKIIDTYKVSGKFLFPWRKDFAGYKGFRDNLRRSMDFIQQEQNIEVLPLGGPIRIKVARHSFATIAKNLFVETDLLRELMGHERDDVDTIYKDKYPQEMRDAAHLKIIN